MNLLALFSAIVALNVAGSGSGIEIFQTDGKDPLDKDVKLQRIAFVPDDANPEHVIVCKSVTEAGTQIPERLCRTLARWEEIASENKGEAGRLLRQIRAQGNANEGPRG